MFHFGIYIFIYGSSHRQVFVRNVGVNLLYNKVRHFKRLKSSAAHTERFQTMLSSRGLMGFMKRTTLEQKNKFTSHHYYRAITKIKPLSTRLKQLEMRHQGFMLRGIASRSGHFELEYSPHVCAGICNLLFYFYSICLLWPVRQCCPYSLYKHELGAVWERVEDYNWTMEEENETQRERAAEDESCVVWVSTPLNHQLHSSPRRAQTTQKAHLYRY